MELTVLGAGPAYTVRPGALGSSYVVQADGAALVLDLGQGVFPSLAAVVEPSEVVAFVVSHLHPDHWIDLVPLRHYLRYEFEPPRRARVHAPIDLVARVDALHDEPGWSSEAIDAEVLVAGRRSIGPFRVEAAKVRHTDDSYAFRVTVGGEGGPGLVYSGDCGVAADLAPLVRPGDTLLTEVAFGPGPVPVPDLHLDGRSVAELARATRPRRIFLTHLQMGYDPDETVAAVRLGYDGPLSFVAPGDRITIPG
jgi:ribonuclease BN (tRNA processing enzyme)